MVWTYSAANAFGMPGRVPHAREVLMPSTVCTCLGALVEGTDHAEWHVAVQDPDCPAHATNTTSP